MQIDKLKGEARLEALRVGGIQVDEWLEKANAEMERQEEEEEARRQRNSISTSVKSESNSACDVVSAATLTCGNPLLTP